MYYPGTIVSGGTGNEISWGMHTGYPRVPVPVTGTRDTIVVVARDTNLWDYNL